MALVAALALAAAAPFRVVQSNLLDREHALALVFDDSLSMAAMDEGQTLIERAAEVAIDQLRRMPEGSEVSLVLAGEPPRVWVRRSVELNVVRDALGELEPRSTRARRLVRGRADRDRASSRK